MTNYSSFSFCSPRNEINYICCKSTIWIYTASAPDARNTRTLVPIRIRDPRGAKSLRGTMAILQVRNRRSPRGSTGKILQARHYTRDNTHASAIKLQRHHNRCQPAGSCGCRVVRTQLFRAPILGV